LLVSLLVNAGHQDKDFVGRGRNPGRVNRSNAIIVVGIDSEFAIVAEVRRVRGDRVIFAERANASYSPLDDEPGLVVAVVVPP
jgi:hypothetical protein